jgi:hypothetical protein
MPLYFNLSLPAVSLPAQPVYHTPISIPALVQVGSVGTQWSGCKVVVNGTLIRRTIKIQIFYKFFSIFNCIKIILIPIKYFDYKLIFF